MTKEPVVTQEEIEKFIKENSTHELGCIEDTGDDLWCLLAFDCGDKKETCPYYNKEEDYCEAYDNDDYVEDEIGCPVYHPVCDETVRISQLIRDKFEVEAYEHSEVWNAFMVFIREPIDKKEEMIAQDIYDSFKALKEELEEKHNVNIVYMHKYTHK